MKKIIQFIFICLLTLNLNIINDSKLKYNYETIKTNVTVDSINMGLYNELLTTTSSNRIFRNQHYSRYYFKNLTYYFPNNTHGTCNYTALSMLLSFYDTYWNDNLIPNQYEYNAEIYNPNAFLKNMNSPGVLTEPYTNQYLNYDQYIQYVYNSYSNILQSLLIKLSLDNNITTPSNLGLTLPEILQTLDKYLYLNNTSIGSIFNVKMYGTNLVDSPQSNSQIYNQVMGEIISGNPVLLRIGNSETKEGHTVIAYDCDSSEIYVHTGWKKDNTALTHVPLSQLLGETRSHLFDTYLDALVLETKTNHIHSDNYLFSQVDKRCPCYYMQHPHDITHSKNYRDTLPTFYFEGLTHEKWIHYDEYDYQISFLNYNNEIIQEYNLGNNNRYTLTKNSDWNDLIKNGTFYKIKITFDYKGTNIFYSDYSITKNFFTPLSYNQIPCIEPSDYNISSINYENGGLHYLGETNDKSAMMVNVKYDQENDLLLMSSLLGGRDRASIYYNFNVGITRVDFQMAICEDSSIDLLENCEVIIYSIINGENRIYKRIKNISNNDDIIDEESIVYESLGVGKSSLRTFSIFSDIYEGSKFGEKDIAPFTNLMILVKYTGEGQETSTLGHVYLGNVAYYLYDETRPLPVSGYELPYEPEKWNGTGIYNDTNCYTYALNSPYNPKEPSNLWAFNPGYSRNDPISMAPLYNHDDKKVTSNYLFVDSQYFNFKCIEISKYEICPIGMYKIAFFGTSNQPNDFHFYRQNPNGTWSHKVGDDIVCNYDASNSIIYYPDECNREYLSKNYDIFIGYFAITPLSDF